MTSMKKEMVRKSFYIALLGVSLFPGRAVAQDGPKTMRGQFSLASQARWVSTVLPPGNYSFDVDFVGPFDVIRIENGRRVVAAFIAQPRPVDAKSGPGYLTLEKSPQGQVVRSLQFPDLGLAFRFALPKVTTPAAIEPAAQ